MSPRGSTSSNIDSHEVLFALIPRLLDVKSVGNVAKVNRSTALVSKGVAPEALLNIYGSGALKFALIKSLRQGNVALDSSIFQRTFTRVKHDAKSSPNPDVRLSMRITAAVAFMHMIVVGCQRVVPCDPETGTQVTYALAECCGEVLAMKELATVLHVGFRDTPPFSGKGTLLTSRMLGAFQQVFVDNPHLSNVDQEDQCFAAALGIIVRAVTHARDTIVCAQRLLQRVVDIVSDDKSDGSVRIRCAIYVVVARNKYAAAGITGIAVDHGLALGAYAVKMLPWSNLLNDGVALVGSLRIIEVLDAVRNHPESFGYVTRLIFPAAADAFWSLFQTSDRLLRAVPAKLLRRFMPPESLERLLQAVANVPTLMDPDELAWTLFSRSDIVDRMLLLREHDRYLARITGVLGSKFADAALRELGDNWNDSRITLRNILLRTASPGMVVKLLCKTSLPADDVLRLDDLDPAAIDWAKFMQCDRGRKKMAAFVRQTRRPDFVDGIRRAVQAEVDSYLNYVNNCNDYNKDVQTTAVKTTKKSELWGYSYDHDAYYTSLFPDIADATLMAVLDACARDPTCIKLTRDTDSDHESPYNNKSSSNSSVLRMIAAILGHESTYAHVSNRIGDVSAHVRGVFGAITSKLLSGLMENQESYDQIKSCVDILVSVLAHDMIGSEDRQRVTETACALLPKLSSVTDNKSCTGQVVKLVAMSTMGGPNSIVSFGVWGESIDPGMGYFKWIGPRVVGQFSGFSW